MKKLKEKSIGSRSRRIERKREELSMESEGKKVGK